MRPDMELVAIGHYDHSNFELVDSPEVSVCLGSDDEIIKMVESDKKFMNVFRSINFPSKVVKNECKNISKCPGASSWNVGL